MMVSTCALSIPSLVLIRASASFSVWSIKLFLERYSTTASSVACLLESLLLVCCPSVRYGGGELNKFSYNGLSERLNKKREKSEAKRIRK